MMLLSNLTEGSHFGNDSPSLVVWNFLFIHQDSHELDNGDGRVSVVHCSFLVSTICFDPSDTTSRSIVQKLTLNNDIVGELTPWQVEF